MRKKWLCPGRVLPDSNLSRGSLLGAMKASCSLEKIDIISHEKTGNSRQMSMPGPSREVWPELGGGDSSKLKPARKTETSKTNSRNHVTTFNLELEFIPVGAEGSGVEDGEEGLSENELTPAQLRALKEDSQKRVKRIVAAVGITLTVISIILVALSLSFGQKIDDLGKSRETNSNLLETPIEMNMKDDVVLFNEMTKSTLTLCTITDVHIIYCKVS